MSKFSVHKRTFSSFKNPAYRLYYASLIGQQGSMGMQTVCRSLLIYRLTGSSAILGTLALAQGVPQVCLSLLGGVIADRVPRKYIMLSGQLVSTLVTLGVAISLTIGYMSSERPGSWWVLIIASVFQGAIMGLTQPAREAIIPQLVSSDQVMNAVALGIMSMNAVRLISPAATGFIIDAFTFDVVYYIMCVMSLISMIFIAFLPRTNTATDTGGNVLNGIIEGIKYTRREIAVLCIIVVTTFNVLIVMPYTQLMPIFTEDILKVGATEMGALISFSGIGSFVTSLVLAALPLKKRGFILMVSAIFLGLTLAIFSFSTSFSLSITMMFFLGTGISVAATTSRSMVQNYVDPSYRGRVISLFTIQVGFMSFGAFAGGVLAESIGAQWTLGGFALTLIFLSFVELALFSKLRKLD